MNTWTFYSAASGEFEPGVFIGSDEALQANLQPGVLAMPGTFDYRTQRVDTQTGEVVAHAWQPDPVAAAHAERAALVQRIRALEDSAARPLRELLLDPTDAAARARLAAVNAQIAALRGQMPTD